MANIFTSHSGLRHDAKAYVMAGRGVVVDSDGRGDFTSVQSAAEYWNARGVGGRIWVRAGTYNEKVTITEANTVLEGESWDALIDGTGKTNALTFAVNYVIVKNIQLKTPKGGSDDDCFPIGAAANHFTVDTVHVSSSDGQGIACYGSYGLLQNCHMANIDQNAIYLDGPGNRVSECNLHGGGTLRGVYISGLGDNSVVTGNFITGMSETASMISIEANAENCLVVGNRVTGSISDSSGTSTVTANETGQKNELIHRWNN